MQTERMWLIMAVLFVFTTLAGCERGELTAPQTTSSEITAPQATRSAGPCYYIDGQWVCPAF